MWGSDHIGIVCPMVAPCESSGPGGAESETVTRSSVRSAAARDALAQLRSLLNNADLAECIPIELSRAGFGRVSLLCFDHTMWVAGSDQPPPADRSAETLFEAGRTHQGLHCKPLPGTPSQNGAAPVYVWQTAVGLLHADDSDQAERLDAADWDVLTVFAEGVGAILERNIALDRIQAMRTSVQTHSAAILSLTTLLGE